MVGEFVVHYPAAHLADHQPVVVHLGDKEIRQFYPYPRIAHRQDGVEDWLQMTATHLHVDVVTK